MRSEIAKRILAKMPPERPVKLDKPFWFDMPIGWRQLHWVEQFLSAKYYTGRNPEIEVPEGKLIFYKDNTVRLIKKDWEEEQIDHRARQAGESYMITRFNHRMRQHSRRVSRLFPF